MSGTPVGRNWIVMMHNGVTAIDWGGGQFLDAVSGNFFKAIESEVSHRASNADLDWLLHIGRIDDYNETYVYFNGLSNLPSRTKL